MKPEECGWHIVDGICLPMQTDKPAEPAELPDIISCSCKKLCNTKRCTCRKHGLHGSDLCQNAEVQVVATRTCLMFPMIAWTEAIAMFAHQQIVVYSFKGPTRLYEDTSANDHACSMS